MDNEGYYKFSFRGLGGHIRVQLLHSNHINIVHLLINEAKCTLKVLNYSKILDVKMPANHWRSARELCITQYMVWLICKTKHTCGSPVFLSDDENNNISVRIDELSY